MKCSVVVVALALPALVFGYVLINPDQVPKTYAPPVDFQSLPLDELTATQGMRLATEPGGFDYTQVSRGPVGEPGPDKPTVRITPFMDWGTNVLVGQSGTTPVFGTLSTDVADNGDIYVALLDPNTGTADTAWVWRSTDAGQTWGRRYGILGNATYGEINDFVLRVGSDANGTWIYNFILYNAASSDGGFWCTRIRADNSGAHMAQIKARGDSIARIAADRNIETPQHLFAGWQTIAGGIRLGSSSDTAQTWGNFRSVQSNSWNVAVCAGGAGYVYIAYIPSDSTYYRVGRYTNNLISPTFVFTNPDSLPTAQARFRDISIAAARTAPGASQWARTLVTYRTQPGGNIGPRHGWSTDGGVSWDNHFWEPTNQQRETWQALGPYIRYSYNSTSFRGVVTLPETTADWDTVVYSIARAAADTWADRSVVNDHRATGEFAAVVDHSEDLAGAYVAYRLFNGNEVWLSGWNWTGVEDQPAEVAQPEIGGATIIGAGAGVRLHLTRPGRVTVTLVDNAGRTVGRLRDGVLAAGDHSFALPAQLSRGVYFLRLDAGGGTDVVKIVRLD